MNKKISDYEIDTMLKNYCARKAQIAFDAPVEEKTMTKRKGLRYAVTAFALIAVLSVGVFSSFMLNKSGTAEKQNGFFITAYAAEATADEAKRINDKEFTAIGEFKNSGGYINQSGHTAKEIGQDFRVNLRCEGKNIDTVTYSFKNAKAFIADCLKDRLVSYTGKSKNYRNTNSWFDNNPTHCYESFTTSYDNQLSWNDKWQIMTFIENNPERAEIFDNYLKYDKMELNIADSKTRDLYKSYIEDFYKLILKNTSVCVTVKYKDGSSETKELILSPMVKSGKTLVADEKTGKKYTAYYFGIGISAKLA